MYSRIPTFDPADANATESAKKYSSHHSDDLNDAQDSRKLSREWTCLSSKQWAHSLWIIPIVSALYNATSDGTSLFQLHYHQRFIFPFAAFTFLSSLGLSNNFSHGNLEEFFNIVQTKHFPNDWVTLPKQREIVALAGASTVTLYSAFVMGTQAYAFVALLPSIYDFEANLDSYPHVWVAVSSTVTFTVIMNMVFGKGLETYKTFRRLLADQPCAFANRFSFYVSNGIGGSLGLLYAIQHTINNLNDVLLALSLNQTGTLALLGVLSPLDSVGDYCLNGRFGVESIDQLIAALSTRRLTVKDTIAFLLASSEAVLIAYGQYFMMSNLLETLAVLFKIDSFSISLLVDILSIGFAADEWIVDTASLFPFMYTLVDRASKPIDSIYQRFKNCFHSFAADEIETRPALISTLDDDYDDEPIAAMPAPAVPAIAINMPSTPIHASHAYPFLFFPRPRREREKTIKPEACEEKSRCHIL